MSGQQRDSVRHIPARGLPRQAGVGPGQGSWCRGRGGCHWCTPLRGAAQARPASICREASTGKEACCIQAGTTPKGPPAPTHRPRALDAAGSNTSLKSPSPREQAEGPHQTAASRGPEPRSGASTGLGEGQAPHKARPGAPRLWNPEPGPLPPRQASHAVLLCVGPLPGELGARGRLGIPSLQGEPCETSHPPYPGRPSLQQLELGGRF